MTRLISIVSAMTCVVTASGGQVLAQTVPLCPGLTIVTAVNQRDGDYESIKTIQAVTDTEVRLKYSVERLVTDRFSSKGPQLVTSTVPRTIRRADLQSATLYLQQFSEELPALVPETTAIGTSAAVLNALKTKGESKFGIFIAFSQTKPGIDRGQHPNVYDNQMVATITRASKASVMQPVILNDVPAMLPTVQATGDFFGDKSEFFFLDDPANPLTLKFRVGIGGVPPLTPDEVKLCTVSKGQYLPNCDRPNGGDKDVLRVIKITSRCGGAPPPSGSGGGAGAGGTGRGPAPGGGGAAALEQSLATAGGKADIYSIYFSFNSDAIREESEPTLKDIAEVLKRHPAWRLTVNGHTDNIGGDQPNLDLSRRRSAAVKDALVKRYGIAADRLTTSGFGRAQPKDTNDTLEGRAKNRRVELVRAS